MTHHSIPLLRVGARQAFGFGLLAWTSLACAGSTTSMTVVNSGASAWLIDSVANPSLTLLRGEAYDFVLQNVPVNHPFNINTTNTTGSGSQYNDGVTNNGATGSTTITFVVPENAPDSLHYNCGNHAAMNSMITIITDRMFANGFEPQGPQ